MSREVEALGSTHPFISCTGEKGGWFISGSLNCTFERQQSWACGRRRGLLSVGWDERPGLSPLPMSWRSLHRVLTLKEDDLKDRSIFIFSIVSHVLDFSWHMLAMLSFFVSFTAQAFLSFWSYCWPNSANLYLAFLFAPIKFDTRDETVTAIHLQKTFCSISTPHHKIRR